ncbi:MAG: patatin-like phospholipase family protein [Saprospiraceae bacterium]
MKPKVTNPKAVFTPVLILFLLFSQIHFAKAQTDISKDKIGLALSGGGAKGIAQVGVIRVLEEEGFRPDLITGTSIGSILGGLYAIGYSIEDLERLAMETEWEYYFDDELERTFYPIEERYAAERYQIRFPIEDGKIGFPKGIVKGKKISLLLSRLTIPAHGIYDFDKFDIPYRAIATDFETGKAIAFGKGDLADAMRASMSIPSVFVPCEIDSSILIDGGVTRNLPVQDVIKLGADKVIAVDIGAPLYDRESLQSIMDVLDQTSSYRIAESNARQAELADVVISPEIADIGALSFDKNEELMKRGVTAVGEKLEDVKALLGSREPLKARGVYIPERFEVVELQVTGCDEKAAKRILNSLQIKEGKIYDLDEVESRIKNLYGGELVALASYRLLPTDRKDAYILRVIAETQKGEFFRVSANYDSRLKAAVLLNLTLRNRFINGSKFNVDLKVSENPSLDVEYFMHTSGRPNIGTQLRGRGNFFPGQGFVDGNRIERFDIRHYTAEANIFSTLYNRYLISTGIGLERYVRSEEYFDNDDNNLKTNQAFSQIRILNDSYDEIHFPSSGHHIEFIGKYGFSRNITRKAIDSVSTIRPENIMMSLSLSKAIKLGNKISTVIGANGGYTLLTENNYFHRFYLGRDLPNEFTHVFFSGLRYMELPVSHFAQTHARLQVEMVKDIFASLRFDAGYYELREKAVEGGVVSNNTITASGYLYGLGLELGMMTRFGPIHFSTEYNLEQKDLNFFLHVGHEF